MLLLLPIQKYRLFLVIFRTYFFIKRGGRLTSLGSYIFTQLVSSLYHFFSADSCDTASNSGVDRDRDGVDDVCDGFIGSPPTNPQINGNIGPSVENQINLTRYSLPTNPLIAFQPATVQPTAESSTVDTGGVVLAESTTSANPKSDGRSSTNNGGPATPSKVNLAMITLALAVAVYFFRKLFKNPKHAH